MLCLGQASVNRFARGSWSARQAGDRVPCAGRQAGARPGVRSACARPA